MHTHVSLQLVQLDECGATLPALVRAVPRVALHVAFQVAQLVECGTTQVALMWLLSCMIHYCIRTFWTCGFSPAQYIIALQLSGHVAFLLHDTLLH